MSHPLDRTLDERIASGPPNRKPAFRGGPRTKRAPQPYSPPMTRRRAQSSNREGSWKHDMFFKQEGRVSPVKRVTKNVPSMSSKTLFVSGLADSVSEEDVVELFGAVGPITKAELMFNSAGESTGTAVVSFQNPLHAQKAIQNYHGNTLDGRRLQITLRDNSGNVLSRLGTQRSSRQNTTPPSRGSGEFRSRPTRRMVHPMSRMPVGNRQTAGGRGRARGVRPQATRKEELTAEQLDAELDEYLAQA
eukprot:GCRY01000616.1.p1 GENE.GCRY01000616.1~~GCRY01000616.1.p1  ORF type:complete len:247 (-),score=14.03 GCRY01000616.1:209-949(-)